MRHKRKLCYILLLITIILSTPISVYASEPINFQHYIFDTDELRLSNLQGELLLDYFEPRKDNLKTETILHTPTINPQNIRYIHTLAYDYDAMGNILLFDFKEYEKGITLNRGKTYLFNYNDHQQLTAYSLIEQSTRWGNPVTYDSSYVFSYNANGQMNTSNYVRNIGKGNASYSYNSLNQLTSIQVNDVGHCFQKEYYYDAIGNCIEYRGELFQNFYTYNEAKQIIMLRAITFLENGSTLSDNTYYFNYDTYGNISAISVVSLYTKMPTRTYNITIQNQYDSLNRLIARNVVNSGSGFTTTYVYEYID